MNAKCSFSLCLLLAWAAACQQFSEVETAETRDAQGRLVERFERRKTDFAKHGHYQRFAENGHLAEEAVFRDNQLDGERKFFYPNGAVEIVEPNRAGVIHGKYRKFYENGALALEQDYANGKLEGLSLAWYPNGAFRERVAMRDNEENGPFTEWHDNGNLKAEGNYRTPDDPDFDGEKEDGELRLYDSLGQIERIMDCQQGICHTRWAREGSAQ